MALMLIVSTSTACSNPTPPAQNPPTAPAQATPAARPPLIVTALSEATAEAGARTVDQSENLALGKPYTLSVQPNYSHSADPGDIGQLTDGKYSSGRFWTQAATLGWRLVSPVVITIDLGKDYALSGLSFRTAAGTAEVHWPKAIYALVSQDGLAWHEAGELVEMSNRHDPLPPYGTYQVRALWTDQLETHGRYVTLMVEADGKYVFVDEVEVFRGVRNTPYSGTPITDLMGFVTDVRLKQQLYSDLAAIEADIQALPKSLQAGFVDQVKALDQSVRTMPHVPMDGFRAILPMTDLERDIFKLQADVWQAQGKPPLRVWQKHRWDPLAPSEEPAAGAPPSLVNVHMMNNEYRADVFNLTNAADSVAVFHLRMVGLGGDDPTYIKVHEVQSVGSLQAAAVSAALPEAQLDAQGYVITVPAGMTRQVWLSFHPTDLTPGTYVGAVEVRDEAVARATIPIQLKIYPIRFPDQTTLLVGGWSYTNEEGKYDITPQNRLAVIAHLREHFVNAPWATKAALDDGTYDTAGVMTKEPDTKNFDQWVTLWPNAKRYMVFKNVKEVFAGSEGGTRLFNTKVGNWARFWAEHMRKLGLSAGQLGILLVDEPSTEEQYNCITAWARAIKAAAPELVIWEDPLPDHGSFGLQTMMASVDVLSISRREYLSGPQWYRDLFLEQREQGRELGLDNGDGSSRRRDPFSYYLLQAWHAFKIGGKGSAFWAFGDNSGVSSWNEYPLTSGLPYSPLYLDDMSVTASKQMEAIREGSEDYEYLVMLRGLVQELEKRGAKAELAIAQELLQSAADRVLTGENGANYFWDQEKDRSLADQVRVEILNVLTSSRGTLTEGQ